MQSPNSDINKQFIPHTSVAYLRDKQLSVTKTATTTTTRNMNCNK